MTEMTTAAPTSRAPQPAGRSRRLARLSGVLTGALVSMVALTGTAPAASAAQYDSIYGTLVTPSGALAMYASAKCGGSSGRLSMIFGAVTPHYWRFAEKPVGGRWSGWSSWRTASQGFTSIPLTVPGRWQFAVQIAYWNGRAWEYDSERVLHQNWEFTVATGWAYIVRPSCDIAR